MKNRYGYIYITHNKVNGKIYIGQHKGNYDENYLGSGALIKKAVAKYGIENFENYIIDYTFSREDANEKEVYWIAKYGSLWNTGFGYNLAKGGNQVTPIHGYTEEQLKEYGQKISKANKGKKRSKEFCLKNSCNNRGKVLSDETKRKISEKKRGKKMKDRKYSLTCTVCGEEFVGGNWNAKYCNTCREKHSNPIATLQFMLNAQKQFQKKLGYDFDKMDVKEKSEYIKEMSLWVQNEVNEMIHEIPFAKHWSKKYDNWDDAKIAEQIQLSKEEITDAFLFMMNIFLCLGMTEQDILDEFCKKNKINIERQETGY